MNVVLRGARVIDPLRGLDAVEDLWLREGVLMALEAHLEAPGATIIDLRRTGPPLVIAPGFIDLHTHLRQPGAEESETVASGAAAAAAGGFTQLLAMANTEPPVDTAARVRAAVARATTVGETGVRVLTASAVTRGLLGRTLAHLRECAAAGAAAFSDDGRNAVTPPLLVDALRIGADLDRAVLVHPEDEQLIALSNPEGVPLPRCPVRPAAAEESAVAVAIHALARAGRGRLHLQHLSCADSLDLLRRARESGLSVTAEVTPHHLLLDSAIEAEPRSLTKVNPPLRSAQDREALRAALVSGLVDAVATDHAPHPAAAKGDDYTAASPGLIGLETAVAACLTAGVPIEVLVRACTAGPWGILGAALREPVLRTGAAVDLVVIDPLAAWTPGAETLHSRSRNTPLLGRALQGRVLLTMAAGRVAHGDLQALGALEAAHV